jgi:hypothetical protein
MEQLELKFEEEEIYQKNFEILKQGILDLGYSEEYKKQLVEAYSFNLKRLINDGDRQTETILTYEFVEIPWYLIQHHVEEFLNRKKDKIYSKRIALEVKYLDDSYCDPEKYGLVIHYYSIVDTKRIESWVKSSLISLKRSFEDDRRKITEIKFRLGV